MASAYSTLDREQFLLWSHDDQLILAVMLALSEAHDNTPDPLLGITADYLWSWYQNCMDTEENHPNVSHRWDSPSELIEALRRMTERGLLQDTVDPISSSGPRFWRTTPAGERYLAKRRVFAYWINGQ